MEWEVEYTEEFETWWSHLSEDEQEDVNAKVILIADRLYDEHLAALEKEGLTDG